MLAAREPAADRLAAVDAAPLVRLGRRPGEGGRRAELYRRRWRPAPPYRLWPVGAGARPAARRRRRAYRAEAAEQAPATERAGLGLTTVAQLLSFERIDELERVPGVRGGQSCPRSSTSSACARAKAARQSRSATSRPRSSCAASSASHGERERRK